MVVYLLLLLPLPLRVHHAANCGGSYSSNGYTASGCPSVGSGTCSSYNCPYGFSGTPTGTVTCNQGSYSGTLTGCFCEWWGGQGAQWWILQLDSSMNCSGSRIHNKGSNVHGPREVVVWGQGSMSGIGAEGHEWAMGACCGASGQPGEGHP